MMQLGNIYKNKKVLITGNTGFKGSWLSIWLKTLGAEVYGISKGIPTVPSLFQTAKLSERLNYFDQDIRDFERLFNLIKDIKPDFVFHLAAQPIVKESFLDPKTTLETNVLGTTYVLESLRILDICCNMVIITSDKCYENVEWTWGYRENDRLGGEDPYSASKGAAEMVIKTYAHSFFAKNSKVKVVSARAGNVIGGGDWAEHRIVPDAIRAWEDDKPLIIRNPNATRPWQHVLEPLSGYLLLGKNLAENPQLNGEAFNFGPSSNQNLTVENLLWEMSGYISGSKWEIQNDFQNFKEAGLLKLNCDKALHLLQWLPNLNFVETVAMVMKWYNTFYQNTQADMYSFTVSQIEEYSQKARERELIWTK